MWSNKKDTRTALFPGIILIGIGLLFLLANLDLVPRIRVLWPVILIIVGLAFIISGKRKPEEKPPSQ